MIRSMRAAIWGAPSSERFVGLAVSVAATASFGLGRFHDPLSVWM
jgi:hypothetical protein